MLQNFASMQSSLAIFIILVAVNVMQVTNVIFISV